jgi:hypothetical protein
MSTRRTTVAALAIFVAAFALYYSTLLPGVDFGDTPSFQVMAAEKAISPRDAYPLYFAIGDLFAWRNGDRARALNLASAVEGAIAVAGIVVVAAQLSGSLAAGTAAALLFAGSYTFWSQAVIAEVYALHIAFLMLTLALILRWERHPTFANLAAFFAVYAAGFGNHLSMILMLPTYALFLFDAAPRGWRSMLAPRVVALALLIAAVGSLQYLWNFRTLWLQPLPPRTLVDAISAFWFDVTKSDWRQSMVGAVPIALTGERLRMYVFDVRQQFGAAALAIAAAGLVGLFRTNPRHFRLVALGFLVNVIFALTYNVGDSHVFFLPSHLLIALLFAPGLVLLSTLLTAVARRPFQGREIVAAAGIALALSRIYIDYPALDRSHDTRPTDIMAAASAGIDDQHAILFIDFNWQVDNGFTYFTKIVRPDVAAVRLADVLRYAPVLVRDNEAIGRDIVLASQTRKEHGAYASLDISPTPEKAPTSLVDVARGLPAGTRYVLTILKPTRELSIDEADLDATVREVANGYAISRERQDYVALGGTVGGAPAIVYSSPRPFRVNATLGGVPTTIRMDSWLEFDTIRRMGFGHVVAARHHALIVERGVSFVAFDERGTPIRVAYAANIFEPARRYRVTVNPQ